MLADEAIVLDGVQYVVTEVTVYGDGSVDITLDGIQEYGPCYFGPDDTVEVVQ